MAPLPPLSAVRRDETIRRFPGSGDDFHTTWAADGRQYLALCDGGGFAQPAPTFYNSRLIAADGDPENLTLSDVPGYPLLDGPGTYYGFGTIAIGSTFYQFLSSPDISLTIVTENGTTFSSAKLIYSDDNGVTWRNQDGSTPVVFPPLDERSAETCVFFREPGGAFSLLSILQMGQGYTANTDGYIYVYSPNGAVEGTMNQLVMFRVPVDRILDRSAYEYFAGPDAEGGARWSPDIADRAVVHTFPSGWVNRLRHPWSWLPSVTYNEPLGVYLMANWGTGLGPNGEWFEAPSYLGIWAAETPWGPWTQILEEEAWAPGGETGARPYHPVIAPKWIAPDGRSFWLIWTDYASVPEPERGRLWPEFTSARDAADWPALARVVPRLRPGYTLNIQRVDLEIG